MRKAKVLFKDQEAGVLTQNDDGSFTYEYHEAWLQDENKQSISLTLPKAVGVYQSEHLFPFFYNMLPEGSNKQVVCNLNIIDTDDYFGLLLTTAKYDTIRAVRLQKLEDQ